MQSTSHVEMIPDLVQRLIVASDRDLGSVALFERIFYVGQRVGALIRRDNIGLFKELFIVSLILYRCSMYLIRM